MEEEKDVEAVMGLVFAVILFVLLLKFMVVYFMELPLLMGALYVLFIPLIVIGLLVVINKKGESLKIFFMFLVLILGITDATVFTVWITLNTRDVWIGAFMLGVLTFVCSLVCLHYLTEACQRRRPTEANNAIETFKESKEQILTKLLEKDSFLEMFTFPVLYLTIRRALIITLTIVYLYLLTVTTLNVDFWKYVYTEINPPSNFTEFVDVMWNRNPFVETFTYAYLAAIAFYFGSRALETYKLLKR